MTQLVATLCENGKKIVTASDRMVSTSDMTLTFEPEESKTEIIKNNALILIAGTIHEPDLVSNIKSRAETVKKIIDIANISKALYQELRLEYIKDRILKRNGLNSFEEFYQCQRVLNEGWVIKLSKDIENYPLGLTLLLAGIDDDEQKRGHIICVENPGTWISYDNLGFCCVGIGERHSDNVFSWYRYTTNVTLNEAAFITFEAKKRAEVSGGVGKDTDMYLIDNSGISKILQEIIDKYEEIYNEREKARERRLFGKEITGIRIKTSKIKIK